MMKKSLLIATMLFFGITFLQAQQNELLFCGQKAYLERLKAEGFDPDHDPSVQSLEEFTQNFNPSMSMGSYQRGGSTIYIIPIVFHIVHKGGQENISDAQVIDAVRILNEDFNKMNSDTATVVSTFVNNIANVGFEFRLAQKDALGNCVNGITRTFSLNTDGGDNSTVDDVNRNLNGSSTNTNAIRYPRDMYLNIWVCNDLGDAAGYTNTPNSWNSAKYDGIWLQHAYTGSIGTGSPIRSRALTHEVGHWFNLSHTWGSTNDPGVSCGNDNVSDTPQTIGWTTCNLSGKTCPADPSPVDNVQNYMDYSYCSRMYTNGQKARMVAAINSSVGQRNELWQVSNLNATGVLQSPTLCTANFTADNLVICEGESVDFTDISYNAVTGWNWTFTGGTPSTGTNATETVVYNTPGTYAVTLTATDGTSNDTETKNAYITVLPSTGRPAPLVEGFETETTLPSNNWMIFNPDNGQAWTVTSTAAYSGTKSAKLSNSQVAAGHTDELISSTIDLSSMSSAVVTFKYAYAMKNSNSTDILKVYASNDCGASWSMRKQFPAATLSTSGNQNSSFTPSSISQWEEGQITNLSASYLTSSFRLKFEFTSGLGNNVYIDDINISSALNVDDLNANFGLTAYPNPFDSQTTVSFSLDNEKDVELNVYDVIGKQVMNLTKGSLSAGEHNYIMDGSDLGAGVYFVKLKAGNSEKVMKVILQ